AERLWNTERLPGLYHAGLQPIDPDRLLVADLVLVPDVHIVAALDHLLGGLREARFIAIGRRDREEARQDADEGDKHQHQEGARMGLGREVRDQTQALRQVLALAASGYRHRLPKPCPSTPAKDGRTIENSGGRGKDNARLAVCTRLITAAAPSRC